MSQTLTVKIAGLYSYPSDLSSVPEGALSEARDVVIDRDSIAEPRRGFDYLRKNSVQSSFSDPSYRANKIFFYQGKLLTHYTPNKLAYHDETAGWINYSGTYLPPAATTPVRSAQANQNFYFTTSTGVYKLAAYNGTPAPIGAPPGLDLTSSVASAPPATWLAAGNAVAYRLVWGIKDANNNVILGAPSQQSQITNTSVNQVAITLVATIPSGITTAHFYQLYRSSAVAAGADPSDELQLVYEGNPTTTDLTNGYVTITDITPDALRGAAIYTAPSQEGLGNANYPAPLAEDLAVFKNCMFYGNTSSFQTYFLTLLGVGAPYGIQTGDTITIAGLTFTAGAAENIALRQFQVVSAFTLSTTGTVTSGSTSLTALASTAGVAPGQLITGNNIPASTFVVSVAGTTVTMTQAATGSATGESVIFTGDSAAQAIRDTALSLVRVINRAPGSSVYAYYAFDPKTLPGLITLQARTVGGSLFSLTSSRATAWNPSLPVSGTAQSSTNDVNKNAIFYSKPSQPEAVPLGNYILVGSADKNILRIVALRDSLFILKEDGIFRLYGSDPSSFQISPLDYTAILIAPESAVALNNQIFALTTQGVVAMSETGVQIMSHAIEDRLTSLISENYTALQTTSFGIDYESTRSYWLFCIANAADTYPTQYLRYNYITNAWTEGSLSKTCGAVNPVDDRLYLGNAMQNIIDIERKDLTYSDYADYSSTQTISTVAGTTINISSADTIEVGSVIYQSATSFGIVTATDPVSGTVSTSLATSLAPGPADVLAPVSGVVTWIVASFGNPGVSKQIREVSLLFLSDFNGSGLVSFSSDINPGASSETISGGSVGVWGEFRWGGPVETAGGVVWGGDNRRRPIRVAVPRNHQRSTLLSVSFSLAYAYSPWKLQGISLIGNVVGERVAN